MIKYDLNNRVAVVTGGAQGFGLAVTERFIDAGAKVVIWDIDEEASSSISQITTFAPASINLSVTAKPKPCAPPVTTATLLFKSYLIILFLFLF